jgi:hypothetical protein
LAQRRITTTTLTFTIPISVHTLSSTITGHTVFCITLTITGHAVTTPVHTLYPYPEWLSIQFEHITHSCVMGRFCINLLIFP